MRLLRCCRSLISQTFRRASTAKQAKVEEEEEGGDEPLGLPGPARSKGTQPAGRYEQEDANEVNIKPIEFNSFLLLFVYLVRWGWLLCGWINQWLRLEKPERGVGVGQVGETGRIRLVDGPGGKVEGALWSKQAQAAQLAGSSGLESVRPAEFRGAHLNCRSSALVPALLVAMRPSDNEKRAPPMIDRAPSDRVAPGAISRPVASAGTWSAVLLVLLAWGAAAAASPHAHAHAPGRPPASKLELWLDLLAALPGPQPYPPPAAGSANLASQLARLPDQRRAALIYMELLARVRQATPPAEWACKSASLAQLSATESQIQEAAASAPQARGWTQLAAGDQRHAHELERALDGQMLLEPSLDAARLALDNANLLSRLLMAHPVRPLLVSRRFFSYLAEEKLRAWLSAPNAKQVRVHSVGMVLLAPKRHFELATQAQLGAQSHQLELVELDEQVALEPPVNRWIQANPELIEAAAASSVSAKGLKLEHGTWSSPYFDCSHSNRWLLTYSVPLFGASAAAPDDSAGIQDGSGHRATPELRGVSFVSLDFARLGLLNQCASIESDWNSRGSGDKSSQADTGLFANTHQCARLEGSQCVRLTDREQVRPGAYVCRCPEASRLAGSESQLSSLHRKRLRELLVDPNESSTIDYLRALLVEQPERELNLAVERLANHDKRAQQGQQHLHQQHHRAQPIKPSNYLAIGYQLETDTSLEWLASSVASSPPLQPWPRQVCRPCSTGNGSSQAGEQSPTNWPSDGNQADEPDCQPVGPEPAGGWADIHTTRQHASRSNWSRPLVGALESLCVLVTLVLLAGLVRVSRSRIILVAGLLMLETMLVGALLLYLSVLIRFLEPGSIACLLEPWLRELGFSIFYGSILIKLYHILTEFQTRKAHRVCFRDKDQIVHLLAIVLIVVGYMSAWTALMVDNFLFGQKLNQRQPAPREHELFSSEASMANAGGELSRLPISLGGQLSSNADEHQVRPSPDWNYSSQVVQIESDDNSTQDSPSSRESSRLSQTVASFGLAPEQLRLLLSKNLNSFSDLFSGLLESRTSYDFASSSLVYSVRCRKLTWDYVTELSEMGLLLFGIHLVYKIRNAKTEIRAEKLYLGAPVCIELIVSGFLYTVRHLYWDLLSPDQFLLLLCIRSLLSVALGTGLIVGPRLYNIVKSKPSLLFGGSVSRAASGSIRHRCHLTCELHDHHLNDAMRLHQAMLSNTALEVGSIGLADMDPDEIQAELKRVYTQLELLKTKAMRRDNPHISKRRGGRKTGHRKFSLQAFHGKHLASQQQQQQQRPESESWHGGQTQGENVLASLNTCHKLAAVPEDEPVPSTKSHQLPGQSMAESRQLHQYQHPNQHQHQRRTKNSPDEKAKGTTEQATSTSSGLTGALHEDAADQSQPSSFVCSQSSIHPDSSVN